MNAKSLIGLFVAILASGIALTAYLWFSFSKIMTELPTLFAVGFTIEYIYVIGRMLKFIGNETLQYTDSVRFRPLMEAFLAMAAMCLTAFSCLFVAHMMYRTTALLDLVLIAIVGSFLVAFNSVMVGTAIGIALKLSKSSRKFNR